MKQYHVKIGSPASCNPAPPRAFGACLLAISNILICLASNRDLLRTPLNFIHQDGLIPLPSARRTYLGVPI